MKYSALWNLAFGQCSLDEQNEQENGQPLDVMMGTDVSLFSLPLFGPLS